MPQKFETISDQPFVKQELLNRRLRVIQAKVRTAEQLSEAFALFCILATVDLNINHGETSKEWLIIFLIITSLLVVCNVLVKIAIMYVTPRLETAVFMARYNIKEFDQILHDDLITYMEYVWIAASLFSSLLFGANFIVIAWVRYHRISRESAVGATVIMAPMVIISLVFAAYSYVCIRRRQRSILLNEKEITSGSDNVKYSRPIRANNSVYSFSRGPMTSSRWDLIRTHVYSDFASNKLHDV